MMRDVYENVDIVFDKFDAYYTWDYKSLVESVTNSQETLKDYIYQEVKGLCKTKKLKELFNKLPVPDTSVEIKNAEWYILP